MLATALLQTVQLLTVGFAAGVVGGMLGVGGGIVMIPAMVFFVGDTAYGRDSFHLYKLAAITTSIVVSIPAVIRHSRAKAIVYSMQRGIMPLAVAGVVCGVLLAMPLSGDYTHWLRRLFGAFLEFVVAFNLYQGWWAAHGEAALRDFCPMPSQRTLIGAVVGFPAGLVAGLLGIGGGVWAVPAQRLFLGIRLRNAIANSNLMIVAVATATAITQTLALTRLPGVHPSDGWWLSLWLAPGALVGGWCGADLTHRLPVRWLRLVFHVVLALAGLRLMLL